MCKIAIPNIFSLIYQSNPDILKSVLRSPLRGYTPSGKVSAGCERHHLHNSILPRKVCVCLSGFCGHIRQQTTCTSSYWAMICFVYSGRRWPGATIKTFSELTVMCAVFYGNLRFCPHVRPSATFYNLQHLCSRYEYSWNTAYLTLTHQRTIN